MRRYLEEHGEFHDLAISTSLLGQMVVAHYFLKKPPAKTAKRVPGLRPPAPYHSSEMTGIVYLSSKIYSVGRSVVGLCPRA